MVSWLVDGDVLTVLRALVGQFACQSGKRLPLMLCKPTPILSTVLSPKAAATKPLILNAVAAEALTAAK